MTEQHACSFCNPGADVKARTFYEQGNWYAILAAPPMLHGHAILAAKSRGSCPIDLSVDVLAGFDRALDDVSSAMRAFYAPKRVVFSSLRLVDPHLHVHVFAVSEGDEHRWRSEKGADYAKGRFFEFLGDQERFARTRHEKERAQRGWNQARQIEEHTTRLQLDVEALRSIARRPRSSI
jgi:diadenosine tetraphosphate (Ap4A) HIT family hydrolase